MQLNLSIAAEAAAGELSVELLAKEGEGVCVVRRKEEERTQECECQHKNTNRRTTTNEIRRPFSVSSLFSVYRPLWLVCRFLRLHLVHVVVLLIMIKQVCVGNA